MRHKFVSDSLKKRIDKKVHYLSDLGDIPITKVRFNNWNPNEMTEEQFKELVAEVQYNEKPPKPIVLRKVEREFYQIIDGEHCFKALQEALHIDSLSSDWYVIEEYNDIEAKRQTYKRNLGGTNNPIKLGLMFESVLETTGYSNNQLAKEWCVSEGTIRNALEYVKAYRLRNSYEVKNLSIRQIREYNRLPDNLRDEWFDKGADLTTVETYRNDKKKVETTQTIQNKLNQKPITFKDFPNLTITTTKKTLKFSIDIKTGNIVETLRHILLLAENGQLYNCLED